MKIDITAALITYNGSKIIEECLDSVYTQSTPFKEVVVVNNNSTDNVIDVVRKRYPDARIIDMPQNLGPNPARNRALRESSTDYVMIIDDDAVLHPECLKNLLAGIKRIQDGAVWSPRIMYYDRKDIIQFDGVGIYYVGEAVLTHPDTPLDEIEKDDTPYPIDVAGGVCYAIDRRKAAAIGYMDESYFFGRTDGEFTFRLTISGFNCYTVPAALAYHKVKQRGLGKAFYQVRNRWYLMLQTYSWQTLLMIIPALVLYEVMVAGFLFMQGRVNDYVKGCRAAIRDLPSILVARKKVQKLKVRSDRCVLHGGRMNIRSDLVRKPLVASLQKGANTIFNMYWALIKWML
jgi:GT2 family glycosyltransferase